MFNLKDGHLELYFIYIVGFFGHVSIKYMESDFIFRRFYDQTVTTIINVT